MGYVATRNEVGTPNLVNPSAACDGTKSCRFVIDLLSGLDVFLGMPCIYLALSGD